MSGSTKAKIVGQRGAPSTRIISGPGKSNTTVLICCGSIGEKGPPLNVLKGKHVWKQQNNVIEYRHVC